MIRQGSATRGRTAAALLCAGVLTAGGGVAVAAAQGADGAYPDCGTYPGGTYPDGSYPGGKYPDGCYPPADGDPGTGGPSSGGSSAGQTGTGGGTRMRRPSQVRLDLARLGGTSGIVRVPKGGLLTLGEISCPAGAACPDVVVMLGRPRSRTAVAASLPGTYGRKVVALPSGATRTLRVRVKKSAVTTLLRRKDHRLRVRLVVSNPAAPPIVRSLTLSR